MESIDLETLNENGDIRLDADFKPTKLKDLPLWQSALAEGYV